MTFFAGGIVPESTQKPGGKPVGCGVGAGAGGVDGGGVGAGAGGVGVGVVEGGVLVATPANGSVAPRPQPARKIPGTNIRKVTALARRFIRVSSHREDESVEAHDPYRLKLGSVPTHIHPSCKSSKTGAVPQDAKYAHHRKNVSLTEKAARGTAFPNPSAHHRR
jgi:hypothetical protein